MELMTIAEVAEYLHIPFKKGTKTDNRVKTVYNLIQQNKKNKNKGIPPYCYKKIGKNIIFIKSRLEAWVLGTLNTEVSNCQDVA